MSKKIGNHTLKHQKALDVSGFDKSVRPVDDFYDYVNGGWVGRTKIPATEAAWGSFYMVRKRAKNQMRSLLEDCLKSKPEHGTDAQKLRDFYHTGTNGRKLESDGIRPIQEELDLIDGIKNRSDLLRVLAQLHQSGVNALWSLGVDDDLKDSDHYALYIGQGGMGLSDPEYYTKDDQKSKLVRKQYMQHIERVFTLLPSFSKRHAKEAARTAFSVESRLAERSMNHTQLRDMEAQYNKRSVGVFEKEVPGIEWWRYLNGCGIEDRHLLIVRQPEFMKQVGVLWYRVTIAEWKTYLTWRLLNMAAPLLSSEYVEENFRFYGRTLRGVKNILPRWERCANLIEHGLPELIGKAYVDRYFDESAKTRMNDLVSNLIAAYDSRMEKLEWMSKATRAKAREKLANMGHKIGYPDKWRNFSDLEIVRDSYYRNCVRICQYEFARDVAKIGEKVDPYEWQMSPATVNAYYDPTKVEVVFPAAFLQPPFFNPEADDAINYGAIGFVIGHEFTHGFDDKGSKFDKDGNLKDWWLKSDRDQFENRMRTLVEQFNQCVVEGQNVNGELTLGENTADLGGLTIAYDAFILAHRKAGESTKKIDGFTPQQRFFMSVAQVWREKTRKEQTLQRLRTDPHSPDKLRCKMPLSNFEPFYDTFGCVEGDGMYLPQEKRVVVW